MMWTELEQFCSVSGRRNQFLGSIPEYAVHSALALSACGVSIWAAPSLRGVLGGGLAILMLAIAIIDGRRFLIPNKLVVATGVLGLLYASVANWEFAIEATLESALRGLVVGAAFLLLREFYRFFRGRDGVGLGDVKLALVAGIWLDWMPMTFAVQVAALAALAVVGFRMARGQRIGGTTVVPFGLFLAPAIWVGWLFQTLVL